MSQESDSIPPPQNFATDYVTGINPDSGIHCSLSITHYGGLEQALSRLIQLGFLPKSDDKPLPSPSSHLT